MRSGSQGSYGNSSTSAHSTATSDLAWLNIAAKERFEVIRPLGRTAGSRVFLCRDQMRGSEYIALKVMPPSVARDPVLLKRFINEVHVASRLSHPNVVQLQDVIFDGEFLAYTTAYVAGGNLFEWFSSKIKVHFSDIVSILLQLARGLQAIHDAGIVHRDLKLENILLDLDGHIRISDFGISLSTYSERLTPHQTVLGTPAYVSPEYVERGKMDMRGDIYALGVIGYELITGKLPFESDTPYRTMVMRIDQVPTPLQAFRPDCPEALGAIVMRALQPSEAMRYQSVREFAADLHRFLESPAAAVIETNLIKKLANVLREPKLTSLSAFILKITVISAFAFYGYGILSLQQSGEAQKNSDGVAPRL